MKYYLYEDLHEFVGGLSNANDDLSDLISYLKPFSKFGFREDELIQQALYKLDDVKELIEEAIETVGMKERG